jgi:hypothetical protein
MKNYASRLERIERDLAPRDPPRLLLIGWAMEDGVFSLVAHMGNTVRNFKREPGESVEDLERRALRGLGWDASANDAGTRLAIIDSPPAE